MADLENVLRDLGQGRAPPGGIEAYLTPDRLATLSHSQLVRLRDALGASSTMQQQVSPFEHRAFAREYVTENPLNAVGLLGAIPAYQAGKMTGLLGSRTPPSWDQVREGYKGVGEGLYGFFSR